MLKVEKGNLVRISFELKVKGGDVIESSKESAPVEYRHGTGKLLPGLEKRLEGMTVGEEKTGTIPAKEAFGEEADMPTRTMARGDFPESIKVEKGLLFEAKGPGGQPVQFKVAEVQDDDVVVRFVHPLAGKDLEFTVKVLLIDSPTAKKREGVAPPPPPAEALKVDLEEDEEGD